MTRTVVGMFDTASEAQSALQALTSAGFTGNDIDLVANNASGEYGAVSDKAGIFDKEGNGLDAGEGATFGATSGAVIGLLVGIGALALPGIGPVIAAGAIGSVLAGTAIGAVSGGIIGGLVGAGIPESDAHVYAEGVRRGGSVLMIRTDTEERVTQAVSILQQHNAVDIDRRSEEYRQGGWSKFDEQSTAYQGSTATRQDEGVVERNLSKAENALERGLGADVDNDGDVGRRDPCNNYGPRIYSGYNPNEGAVERHASKIGNAVESGTGADLDNDGDVGTRDTRNNV
jgi:hypothetical protein